ncbi:hypothetical protein SAMN02745165_01424 [Malonomonas rubra DSM 5091]|uniref:Uncharacterized protein n=1 Tax=Malonomonas rubra DSM 5091 TaxID=1122189 RepID=A0A1M6G636_MALRU|nr:hypothetical protein [Malonomonas rubra]SHJ05370.1 hypothetical protein SAMN02745165_01424 [Malonomonas rubra DSM 5091]
MNDFIVVSAHINRLLGYFCQYFSHESLSKAVRQQILSDSNRFHLKLRDDGDLPAYDQHLELAKSAYRIMLLKLNQQEVVDDILFCGESELSWEETSRSLSDLYQLNLNCMELYTFYYLHEINNHFYIDSPLPQPEAVNA